MTPALSLHPQLAQDTYVVTDLPLCRVLLVNDARYPWCILVPRRAQCREIHDLSASERTQLWAESDQISSALMAVSYTHLDVYKRQVRCITRLVSRRVCQRMMRSAAKRFCA